MDDPLDINSWGPKVWDVIHLISFSYPIQASPLYRSQMNDFLYSIANVLPCKSCSEHFNTNLGTRDNNAPWLSGRRALTEFLVDIHNKVNNLTDKSTCSYQDVTTRFCQEDLCESPVIHIENKHSFWLYTSISLLVLLLLFLLWKRLQ